MILQPVVPGGVLVLLFVPPLVFLVWQLVTAGTLRRAAAPIRRTGILVLLFVAALGPALPHGGTTKAIVSNADVFIVMDTTTSSNAEDYGDGRTRLDQMKQDVTALTQKYAGARFALLTFDAAPVLRVPLVTDTNALQSALQTLSVEVTKNSRGSSPFEPADFLDRTLREAHTAHPDRLSLVFYLGDGETTSDDPAIYGFDAAGREIDAGAVLGYGTAQGGPMRENDYLDYAKAFEGDGSDEPVPVPTQNPDAPYLIDPDTGQRAVSRIDETTLRKIASQLGVAYQHRAPGTTPSLPSVDDRLGKRVDVPDESIAARLYWIPVIPAFLLLAWDLLVAWRALAELRVATPRKGARS